LWCEAVSSTRHLVNTPFYPFIFDAPEAYTIKLWAVTIKACSHMNIKSPGVIDKHVIFYRLCKHHLKASLHNGDYRAKLVPFEAQKNILYIEKRL
jgi:hypothetical protein